MYNEAIQDYTSALRIKPNHFKALFNRAFCLDKIGNYKKANGDYEKAL
jgi:tetratricopeptide (TPR) repeat protein